MAQFPRQEMDVFSLVHATVSGYQINPGYFPNADFRCFRRLRMKLKLEGGQYFPLPVVGQEQVDVSA